MNTFGSLLKSYRQKRGISQKALGMRCEPGFSREYIIKLEVGNKIAPPEESVMAIAKALALSEREIQTLCEAAKRDRLSYTFSKNKDLEVDSIVKCLLDNLSQEKLLKLTTKLQQQLAGVKQ